MVLNFNEIDIAVNGSGILANNCSISTNNSIEAAYILGHIRPINQLPQGSLKTTLNTSYLPVINQEPNFATVNKIKSMLNDFNYLGEKVEFAGLHHDYWFMDNYSLKIQPNNIVESNVVYSTYWELCGDLRQKSNNINYLGDGSICHAWTTYILNTGDYLNVPVYDLSYDFSVEWRPVYVIGKKYPIEMRLLNAVETLSFSLDIYNRVLFTGQDLYPNIFNSNNGNLELKNVSLVCLEDCNNPNNSQNTLSINISGFKIKSVNPESQVGQYLRINYVANKYY